MSENYYKLGLHMCRLPAILGWRYFGTKWDQLTLQETPKRFAYKIGCFAHEFWPP